MTMRLLPALLAAAMLLPAPPLRAQTPAYPIVYIKTGADQRGQGMTRMYRGQCYVVTPEHVVEGLGGSTPEISIITLQAREIPIELPTPASPVTILHLPPSEDDEERCAPAPSMRQIGRALRALGTGREGTLSVRLTNGDLEFVPVRVKPISEDGNRLHIEALGNGWLQTGVSGGLVYVNMDSGEPVHVGMVLERPTGGADTLVQTAEAYTLTHVESAVRPFFRYRHRPGAGTILASVFIPGLGQRATTRTGTGWGVMAATAAAVVVTSQLRDTETRIRTDNDALGIPRQYPYEVRVYPHRAPERLAAVWLAGGALSALETYIHVATKYPHGPGATPARPAVRVGPRATMLHGEPAVALAVELRF